MLQFYPCIFFLPEIGNSPTLNAHPVEIVPLNLKFQSPIT